MYFVSLFLRVRFPRIISFINNMILYPYRRTIVEIRYQKNKDHIFPIFFEGARIQAYLPYRHDLIEQTIIAKQTFFEIAELTIAHKYIEKNAVFVDIGANIGNHLLFFAKCCGAKKIIAFEPNPIVFPVLQKNIVINQLEGIVTAYQIAIGSLEGSGEFTGFANETDPWYTNRSIRHENDGSIQIRSLDTCIPDTDVDIIKIDVEGMEIEVIKGSINIIRRTKPVIFIESDKIKDVLLLLHPIGYYVKEELPNFNYILLPTNDSISAQG